MKLVTKTSQQVNADVFTAIAHPARRKILDLLAEEEKSVQSLAKPFNMSRPAVSQHLRILREAGLVETSRAGREQHYRLCSAPLEEIYDWVTNYRHFWADKLDALGQFLEENS